MYREQVRDLQNDLKQAIIDKYLFERGEEIEQKLFKIIDTVFDDWVK